MLSATSVAGGREVMRVRVIGAVVIMAGSLFVGAQPAVSASPSAGHPPVVDRRGPTTDQVQRTGGAYHSVVPARVVDTATGTGLARGRIQARASRTIPVLGRGGIPAGPVAAVLLRIGVINPTATGSVVIWADGSSRPGTSSAQFGTRHTTRNLALVRPGTKGRIDLFNNSSGSIDLVADVIGWYETGSPLMSGGFTPVRQQRILDTFHGVGTPSHFLASGGTITVHVAGMADVPAYAAVVAIQLSVLSGGGSGPVTAWAAGSPRPATISGAVGPHGRSAALDFVALGSTGKLSIHNGTSGPIHLLGDVEGWFPPSADPVEPGGFLPVGPTRVLARRPIGPHQSIHVALPSSLLPVDAVDVALTASVSGASSAGALALSPSHRTWPAAPALSFDAGGPAAAPVIVRLGDGRSLDVTNTSSATANVAVDLTGRVGLPSVPTTTIASTALIDPPHGSLDAIGCAASDDCVAVDSNGFVVRTAGEGWTPPERDLDHGFTVMDCTVSLHCFGAFGDSVTAYSNGEWAAPETIDAGRTLTQLSCGSEALCLAVDDHGAVFRYDGQSWSKLPNVDIGHQPMSVSCPSATFCALGDADGGVLIFDGTVWSDRSTVTPGRSLTVGCSSATWCAGIGTGSSTPTASFFDGTSWTAPVGIVTDAGYIQRVDCASPSRCEATGESASATYDGVHWSGTFRGALAAACVPERCWVTTPEGWVQYRIGDSALGYRVDERNSLIDVSCVGTGFCMAVDDPSATIRYENGAWSAPSYDGTRPLTFSGVSCASRTFCLAVTDAGSAARWDGADWTTLPPSDALWDIRSVECVSATLCLGYGGKDIYEWNGVRWSKTVTDRESYVSTVSCSSENFCAAMDFLGTAWIRRGGTWSEPQQVTHTHFEYGAALSCPIDDYCLVAGRGDLRGALTYEGARWTVPDSFRSNSGTLDCIDQHLCLGPLGWPSNGRRWGAPRPQTPANREWATTCVTGSTCFGARTTGTVTTYQVRGS